MSKNNNIWFTSDTHYGHVNIIKYSNRPFRDVETMNNMLVANWNSKVAPSDIVYHLGDVAFMHEDATSELLNRLNGNIVLIYGNHDSRIRSNRQLKNRFNACYDYHEIEIEDPTSKGGFKRGNLHRLVVLCHYPMITWKNASHGSLMLHGHCHGNLKYPYRARIMDVGVDPQNYSPISAAQVLAKLMSITPEAVDHHRGD